MNYFTPFAPTPHGPNDRDASRDRQLTHLIEMQQLGMALARKSAAEALATPPQAEADPAEKPRPAAADPTLAFSRATRAVRQAVQLENRIAEGPETRATAATRAPKPFIMKRIHDPKHAEFRQALHEVADTAVADRPARTQLRRHLDDRLEQELADHPELPPYQTFRRIARALNLRVDPAKLPDILLGPPIPKPPFATATFEEEQALIARARASPA